MLHKATCKKCYVSKTLEEWKWKHSIRIEEKFEERWNKGYVICPFAGYASLKQDEVEIDEEPPSRCPYLLEILLLNAEQTNL